jgi:hypothetical protein
MLILSISQPFRHLKRLQHEAGYYKLITRVMPGREVKKEKLDQFNFGEQVVNDKDKENSHGIIHLSTLQTRSVKVYF